MATSSSPGRALTMALAGGRRPPAMRSVRESTEAAGGTGPIARQLSGIPQTGRLPRAGTDEHRAYRARRRRLERYLAGTRGQKRADPAFVKAVRAAARQIVYGPGLARARRHGLRMRIRAWITVSRPPPKVHTMPADVAGRPAYTHLEPYLVDPVLDVWERDDEDAAGAQLLAAFFLAYWGAANPAEIDEIEWVEVRLA